jgi:hypothetical protein
MKKKMTLSARPGQLDNILNQAATTKREMPKPTSVGWLFLLGWQGASAFGHLGAAPCLPCQMTTRSVCLIPVGVRRGSCAVNLFPGKDNDDKEQQQQQQVSVVVYYLQSHLTMHCPVQQIYSSDA